MVMTEFGKLRCFEPRGHFSVKYRQKHPRSQTILVEYIIPEREHCTEHYYYTAYIDQKSVYWAEHSS